MLEKIKDILNNSKKPHNSLKPLQKELENFKNTIYPDIKLTLIEIAYIFINRDEDITCSICNKRKEFINIENGFRDFCSVECESKRTDNIKSKDYTLGFLSKIKDLNNQKQISLLRDQNLLSSLFFYTNFLTDLNISERIYCLLNNVENIVMCSHCNKEPVKFKNSSLGYFKYCSNSCSFKATKEDRKNTNLNKYGVENTFKLEIAIENKNNVMADKNFIEKCKKTKEEKYGKDKKKIYEKVKLKWAQKTDEEKISIRNAIQKRNIELYGENYQSIFSEKSTISKKLKSEKRKIKILEKIGTNISFNNKSKIYLKEGFFNFIKELGIDYVQSDRNLIKPLELDLLIGNLAIEYNGLYYHSYEYLNEMKSNSQFIKESLKDLKLNSNIGKSYHLLKSKLCNLKGVNLIHINEDEWQNPIKQRIWKSILKNKLNLNKTKIYARDCYIKEIDNETKNDFLDENHLQGKDSSSLKYGLFLKKNKDSLNKDELVSVMTFGPSRYGNKEDYEMYRFCNKLEISVIGSASKLFKHFIKINNPKEVLSYGDRRLGFNNFYEKIGFRKVDETSPGFKYVKNNTAYNRELFKKHLLEGYFKKGKFGIKIYDTNFTGEEIMSINGFKKIYDCGNNKYVFYK